MKKILCLLSFVLLFFTSNTLLAHGDDDHKKEQDSTEVVQKNNVNDETVASSHQEVDHYNMITESEIIEATMDDFSNLHPLVVHFPIVLLLLAVLTQFASFFLWKKQMNWVTLLLLLGGFLGAYVASTFVHPHTTGLTDAATAVLEKHDQFAYLTIWLSGIGLLFKSISMFFLKNKVWLEIIVALLLAVAAFTVSKAGHYGATLSQIHGIGVQGNFIEKEDSHNH